MQSNLVDDGRLVSYEAETNNKESEVRIAQSCNGCVFAEVKNNRQQGCKFDRLTKFRKTTEITYVEKRYEDSFTMNKLYPELFPHSLTLKESNQYFLAEYHDGEIVIPESKPDFVDEPDPLHEVSYAVINDRYCNLYRSKYSDWGKDLSDEQKKETARDEVKTKFSALIYFDESATIEDLRTSIQSCVKQSQEIAQVIVLNAQSDIAVTEVIKEVLAGHPNVAWTNSRSLWQGPDIGICVDDVLGQDLIIGAYFLLLNAGTAVSPNILENLDKSLNDNLGRWMFLTSKDILVVQTKLAKVIDGYQEIKPVGHDQFIYGLENKIRWFADKMDKAYFVKELADVIK